jgi:hypothetical protein
MFYSIIKSTIAYRVHINIFYEVYLQNLVLDRYQARKSWFILQGIDILLTRLNVMKVRNINDRL